ncbi:MAG TPA: HEAT repeat domain-containing protein, partial [Thermoanaerobaculia bacterium]
MNIRLLILAGLVAASCRTSPAPAPEPMRTGGGGETAVARLADPSPAVRLDAAAVLGVPGASDAIEPLADRAVHDEIAQVRWRALASLVRIDRRDAAVAALLPSLESLDPAVQWRAAVALAMFEEPAAIPVLHAGVLSPDPYRRLEAITALGQVHDARTPEVLRPLLESPSANDR